MTRVLLVDDHPMIRTALEALLRDTGFEIVGVAGTGEAALREVNRLDPDILLLDLQMPGGNGMEVLRQLRAERSIRVILLTAAIEDSALLVEWPERAGEGAWPEALRLNLEVLADERRSLTADVPTAWEGRWPPP